MAFWNRKRTSEQSAATADNAISGGEIDTSVQAGQIHGGITSTGDTSTVTVTGNGTIIGNQIHGGINQTFN
ncbi:hypothetical protein [Streptomyces litchfieldiae]|uniref:Uncharacterized protein n=1 Tax=Streptomyces litchfieldiae TaxID=3075543 RepID=A0ABU2N3B3_9ACTN|nr:hypothetical protein [Streptomyces sp. DSM 44938]MDT0347543.1 hypothetical protein [Streptomyces sp. DSM 44938]